MTAEQIKHLERCRLEFQDAHAFIRPPLARHWLSQAVAAAERRADGRHDEYDARVAWAFAGLQGSN